jgi:hypothetical protein
MDEYERSPDPAPGGRTDHVKYLAKALTGQSGGLSAAKFKPSTTIHRPAELDSPIPAWTALPSTEWKANSGQAA